MTREAEAMGAIEAINKQAREARLLCNDIIRQTSLKPYYGKMGGAAVYAAADTSDEQRRRIKAIVMHMRLATAGLYDIAVEGGLTEAKMQHMRFEEIMHPDSQK